MMNIFNADLVSIFLFFVGLIFLVFFLYAAIVSFIEKENRAAYYFIFAGILSLSVVLLLLFYEFAFQELYSTIVLGIIVLFLAVYIIPVSVSKKIVDIFPTGKIDERNIMFSRIKLEKGTDNYFDFYSRNPDKQLIDDKIRNNAGLLSDKSTNYNHAMFSSAHSSFFAVDAFSSIIDGEVSPKISTFKPEGISNYIKNWTKKLGAVDVGITELKDYHKYSYRGRKNKYGNKVNLTHKYAIAFTIEMDYDALKTGPHAPSVMESAQMYLESGAIAIQLAEFIRKMGYAAKAHIDGNYEVVCALVAKDAGLGELGRMGLLMTPKLGPRVRIAVVTTDIPLVVDKRGFNPTVIDFCNYCKKCADVCPSNAISFDNRKNINGVKRWQINQEACFNFWTIVGTDCGKCVSACPYSHPNNLLHNIVRFGIDNSSLFSKLALHLDDTIYGRKPLSKLPANWMKME